MRRTGIYIFLGIIFLPLDSFCLAANFTGSDLEIVAAAETTRIRSAVFWTGKPLPGDWFQPCPILIVPADHSGGGATSFRFENGEVHSWSMTIAGSKSALLKDVLPHEVDHAVRASLIRHPIERWLDEGCATLFESPEVQRQLLLAAKRTDGSIIRSDWLNRFDYPNDPVEIERLYAVGFSLVSYLLSLRDAASLLELQRQTGSVERRIKQIYGLTIIELRDSWDSWKRKEFQSQTALKCACGQTSKPLLVIWTAKWCGGCRLFWDAWNNDLSFKNELQSTYHIHILEYDEHRGLALLHGIQHLPTFQTQQLRVIGFEHKELLLNRLQFPLNQTEIATIDSKIPEVDSQSETETGEAVPGTVTIEISEKPTSEESELSATLQVTPDAAHETTWYENLVAALPVGLTLLQWSGIIGGTAATGGALGFAMALLPKLLARRKQRESPLNVSAKSSAERGNEMPVSPFPRELDEARQLLEIRQSEGRVAVLDALRGMFLEDEIEKIKSTQGPDHSLLLDELLSAVDQRVNEVAPLSIQVK